MTDLFCWETKFEPCNYSNRLLSKLLLLNTKVKEKIDITEIKKAIYYARKYHGTQKRQSGEAYYSHPIEVAYMIADYVFKSDVLVTSILHDTLEDTKLTKDMISDIFGLMIANNVEDLTRIKLDRKISSAEIMKSLYLQSKKDLLLIKIFDRLHNMQTIKIKAAYKINKTIHETVKHFMSIIMYLRYVLPNMLLIENELMALCLQNLPKDRFLSIEQLLHEQERFFEENYQLVFPAFQNDVFPDNFLYLLES